MKSTLMRSCVTAGVLACGAMVAPSALAQGGGGHVKTFQRANLHDLPGMTTDLGGAATLVRTRQHVEVRIAATGLDTDAAYTVWWVMFNNPDACVGGCGVDDLGTPAVQAAVVYAAGFVTGADATANLTAHLDAGRPPRGSDVLLGHGLERGNGFRSEIHMVLRSHGPIVPGLVDAQIGSFSGACDVNACVDQQAVAFLPVP